MTTAINVNNLKKIYRIPSIFFWNKSKSIFALKNISFTCPKQKITCILGPNGAGKTTIIKILSNLIIQDNGAIDFSATSSESNSKSKKIKIGVMTPNERSFYWRLTGRQNINFFAELYGISGKQKKIIVNQLIEELNLTQDADKPFRLYSTGMKYKLLIARSLICNPDILLLDEPTSHIDPIAKENIHQLINENFCKKRKMTIIICTHDLSEAQQLADHIILLNHGEVIAQGSLSDLRKMINPNIIFQIKFEKKLSKKCFKDMQVLEIKENDNTLEFYLENKLIIPDLINKSVESGGRILWSKEYNESLLDIFKRLTNR